MSFQEPHQWMESRGWRLLSVRPEIIIAEKISEEGSATIGVKFGPQHIVIDHLASRDMAHGSDGAGRTVVAETYNIWVKELERAIAGQVSGL